MSAGDEPRPITILSDSVVNKIAAGEVVVRPMNAIKEMMENSLDAGATEITITIKNGGLDLIKIKDNGNGINQTDYVNVCERFATSKLETLQDLQRVTTFGFRGEALASISCMAKVQVTSRPRNSNHAWACSYENCKPVTSCIASAGLSGTQIVVEQLFAAYPHRRSAFKYPQEEALQILTLISKYAIHYPEVTFSVIRHDGKGSFRSTGSGDRHAVIKMCHPTNVPKDLIDFQVKDDRFHFLADVCMAAPLSSVTSTAIKAKKQKQKLFQLFINNRVVSSNKLKAALDLTFGAKDAYCPFIHISMKIDPARMDVNVHPTKEYVYFLDEAEIIESIQTKLTSVIDEYRNRGVIPIKPSSNNKPVDKKSQPVILDYCNKQPSTSSQSSNPLKRKLNESDSGHQSEYYKKSVAPKLMVRVDARNRTLDEFFGATDNDQSTNNVTIVPNVKDSSVVTEEDIKKSAENDEVRIRLQKALKERIQQKTDASLQNSFKFMILIGFIDGTRAAFQCKNVVLLVEVMPVLEELFYQRAVHQMGNTNRRRLLLNPEQGGVPLVGLVDKYIDDNKLNEQFSQQSVDEHLSKLCDPNVVEMLWETFGICLEVVKDVGPCLQAVLCLVDGYTPLLDAQLSQFAFDLVTIDWSQSDIACHKVCKALANLHTPHSIYSLRKSAFNRHCQVLKCQVFPLFKTHLSPLSSLRSSLQEVISTMHAFKIFGRC